MDPRAPDKQARCLGWLSRTAEANALTINAQVCGEARSVAVRKLNIKTEAAAKAIRGLLPWCTAPCSAEKVRLALELAEQRRLSWRDGLLLASAINAGCPHFLTENAQSAPIMEGMHIIDPFLTLPEDVLGAA